MQECHIHADQVYHRFPMRAPRVRYIPNKSIIPDVILRRPKGTANKGGLSHARPVLPDLRPTSLSTSPRSVPVLRHLLMDDRALTLDGACGVCTSHRLRS